MRAQPTECACTQQHAKCSVFNNAHAEKRFLTCLYICYWNHITICIFTIAIVPETSSFYIKFNYFHNKSCPLWQNPRMVWFQSFNPLPLARTCFTKVGCFISCPTWPWTLPGASVRERNFSTKYRIVFLNNVIKKIVLSKCASMHLFCLFGVLS